MNQPPAFQFYVDNFVQGTCDMACEEVGAYVRLLCYQWSNGSIPKEKGRLFRVAGGDVSEHVLSKFKKGQDGCLRNERMERERLKQDEYRKKQAEYGKTGGRPKKGSLSEPFHSEKGSGKGSQSSPSPSPTPVYNTNGATTYVHGKELDRVIERMKTIKATYGDHQSWSDEDVQEYNKLRIRRSELRKTLGVQV